MRLAFLFILFFIQTPAHAFDFGSSQNSLEPSFLTVQEAFQFSVDGPENGKLNANWNIATGYYLYKSRISLSGPQADKLHFAPFPKGEDKTDPYFGDVVIYKHALSLPIYYDITLPAGTKIHATLHFQGCAEKGLCYPPQTMPIEFTIPNPKNTQAPNQATNSSSAPLDFVGTSQATSISQIIASSHIWTALAALFGFGLLLSFTPCVLPMIPIVSAIVVGTRRSKLGSFYYSVIYVLAMALTYGAIGALAGIFGLQLNLQAQLQSPILLSISALLFVVLAMSMFGLFELRLPASWQSRLEANSSNDASTMRSTMHSTIKTALAGILATLIVSPCVSAPVAGVLLYISSQGDIWYGALMLFVMALGMGVPLLIVGLFGPTVLPKSGPWLNDTKVIMGVALLAVAIWLITRWLPGVSPLFLWGALALAVASYFFHRINQAHSHPVRWFLALIFTLIGAIELYGAAAGANSPLNPIRSQPTPSKNSTTLSETNSPFSATIQGLTELKPLLKNGDKRPIVLDVYADWCISCKIIEEEIFNTNDIRPLLDNVQLVRVDLTDNTSENQAFMKHFNLFGPPALLFLDATGNEQKTLSLIGEPSKHDVLTRLEFVTK